MTKHSKLLRTFLFVVFIGFSFFGLTSCASTSQEAICYDFSLINYTHYSDNTTFVNWSCKIKNNSIFAIKEESFDFELFDENGFVGVSDSITYSVTVKPDQSKEISQGFLAKGRVIDVKIRDWSAVFSSLWDTYIAWFIVTISLASIASIAFIIAIICNELDFDDIQFFLEDYPWVVAFLPVPFVPYLIISIVNGAWSFVPPLIIGGGILAPFIAGGIVFLIINLKDEVFI